MSVRVLHGDALTVLRTLPSESVHCCVTSPPYFGLRDYGTGTWEGGDPGCDHKGGPLCSTKSTLNGGAGVGDSEKLRVGAMPFSAICGKCGARRIDQQIGLEGTPAEYIARLVEVFREVKRVLRSDGTCWVNMGDGYSSGSGGDRNVGTTKPGADSLEKAAKRNAVAGQKPKDLLGIPWLLAFALRDDGWYLRSEIIWAKPNPMPESVRDRPTRAHEQIFLLTKKPRYFYDATAIEEDGAIPPGTRAAKGSNVRSEIKDVNGRPPEYWNYTGKRNKRSVWTMTTHPFPQAHFATFPPELPETCIKAGTSERGCCPECGAGWVRVTTKETREGSSPARNDAESKRQSGNRDRNDAENGRSHTIFTTVGWRQTCACPAADPGPCTVLDPFSGSGTTALVADRLQRHAIGIDLHPRYNEMARKRVDADAPLFAEVER